MGPFLRMDGELKMGAFLGGDGQLFDAVVLKACQYQILTLRCLLLVTDLTFSAEGRARSCFAAKFELQDAMASVWNNRISKLSLVCVSIVMAVILFADATTAADSSQQLSPNDVAALTQQAYLRGNTDVFGASTKRAAVVTEEMHVGDTSVDAMFGTDYSNGKNPSANCRSSWDHCP